MKTTKAYFEYRGATHKVGETEDFNIWTNVAHYSHGAAPSKEIILRSKTDDFHLSANLFAFKRCYVLRLQFKVYKDWLPQFRHAYFLTSNWYAKQKKS